MQALTELSERERAAAAARFQVIRAHIERGTPLVRLALRSRIPLRTARRWVERYRTHGLAGLARQSRSDRGGRRSISPELTQAIEGLALAQPPMTHAAIRREIAKCAHGRPPSYTTVRRVVSRIAPSLLVLGREGEKAYRDSFELILRREASAPNAFWQADHTQLDVVILDDFL